MAARGNEFYTRLPAELSAAAGDRVQGQRAASEVVAELVRGAASGASQDPFDSRVRGKVVQLDNPATKKPQKEDMTKAGKKVGPRTRMNAREQRELHAFELPKEQQKYALFQPLHSLWTQYIKQLLGNDTNPNTLQTKLSKADWHGAVLSVSRSTCPSYVGLRGIVVKETQNMFYIVTQDDCMKAVPKRNATFALPISAQSTVTLYGNQLICRSAERSARKFKAKPTIDL